MLDDPTSAHAIGAQALRTGMHHALVLLLRALGSPAQVYRQLPRAVAKFSTTSTLQVLDLGVCVAPGCFELFLLVCQLVLVVGQLGASVIEFSLRQLVAVGGVG